MKGTTLIAIAAALTACGAAATNSDDAADQGARRSAKQKPARPDPNAGIQAARDMASWDEGGMPGCFDPALSGRQRAVAERLGGVPCDGPTTSPAGTSRGAGSGGAQGFAGHWRGQFDGGQGEATIAETARGSNRYVVRLVVAGEGCGGEIPRAAASVRSGALVMTTTVPDGSGQCTARFARRGNTLTVQSSNCSHYHGMSCGFSGSLRYVHGTDPEEPEEHFE